LWVTRLKNEWRVASLNRNDADDRTIEIDIPSQECMPNNVETLRFGGKETGQSIRIIPALADRPVVIRPEMPFYLPSGEEVTIFVSTPLWLNLCVAPHFRKLISIPTLRLSDSWFGVDPTEGELCYAAKTKAKLRFEDLTLIQYRAVTKVLLKNDSSNQLFLERIKVPVHHLSLYRSNAGLLTETITIVKDDDHVEMRMRLDRPTEAEFGQASKISMPRQPLQKNILIKAINTLIG